MKRLLALIVFASLLAGISSAADRPNILLILADDMGFSDPGCYGGEIHTPNLDRLAAGGLRFSQFYNCALCGPSRAALMTGLYPHQTGVSGWTGLLSKRCVTMCELLKRAGYFTGATGRLDMTTAEVWHDPVMLSRVLDRYFGSTGHQGPGNYFKNVRNNEFYLNGQPYSLPDEGGYKTDLITDFTVKFIEEAKSKEQPFFFYMAHYAPHWPLHAKPEDIAKYRTLYHDLGWDEARAARYKRLVDMEMINPKCQLSPRDARAQPWTSAQNKDWEAERMAVYAAQIDSLDQSVGRVVEALRRTGADRNTLVLFLSDNGASDQGYGALDKPGLTWRLDGTPTRVGNTPDIWPGPADTFVTAGPAWSNLSNTPFRQHKNTNFEGGIATPLIASWPGVIQQAGAIVPDISHLIDLMPTLLDVAQVTYPTAFEGRTVTPLSGHSLLPVLKTGHRAEPPSICWSTSGCRAVRMGSWKLVSAKDEPWELYNMETDRTELNNLAAKEPERVEAMAKVFAEWQAMK